MFDPDQVSPPQWVRDQWSQDPRTDDILFPNVDQWKNFPEAERGPAWANAALHIQDEADSYAYVSGYRLGAQVLAQAALEGRYQTNVLVYPILYLYRHTVELHLKRIIPMAAQLGGPPLSRDEKRHMTDEHSVRKLWNILKPRLSAPHGTWLGIGDDRLAGMDAHISQLDAVDEKSFCFRYATEKNGRPNLADLRQVNTMRITSLLERLCSALESIDEEASRALEANQEKACER
jgi:hypothetical protein